ncbi:MAG: hypothetical protein OEY94_10490, partial [Alphaproteobacteria bacterium]|nr:hypothetical protein [Alphaproteobacteria bacterium]
RLDINHIYEEKCFDYLQDRYGDKFEKEIKHGRALLLTMYIFKYITIGQWKKSWHMLKALCHLVRGDISLLWFITSKIFKNMAQRILLLLKTKRINR